MNQVACWSHSLRTPCSHTFLFQPSNNKNISTLRTHHTTNTLPSCLPQNRKKTKYPPTNDAQFNQLQSAVNPTTLHHEANETAPRGQQEHTQQDIIESASNATLDQMTLEQHRRIRRFLDDMKAEIQRREDDRSMGQEALKQNGRERFWYLLSSLSC